MRHVSRNQTLFLSLLVYYHGLHRSHLSFSLSEASVLVSSISPLSCVWELWQLLQVLSAVVTSLKHEITVPLPCPK